MQHKQLHSKTCRDHNFTNMQKQTKLSYVKKIILPSGKLIFKIRSPTRRIRLPKEIRAKIYSYNEDLFGNQGPPIHHYTNVKASKYVFPSHSHIECT